MANTTLTPLGQEIFETRYAYPGETKWAERAKVIAKTIASAERDEDKEKAEKHFYEAVGSGDFIPGGRIIFGAGRVTVGIIISLIVMLLFQKIVWTPLEKLYRICIRFLVRVVE